MARWSAHLGYLYTDLPLRGRIAAAAADGFTAVEHPEPFEVPADEMRSRLADLGLSFSQITTGMGDMTKGEKGLASLDGRQVEFRAGLERAIDYAQTVGGPYVHPMAGVPQGDGAQVYADNIALAMELAGQAGLKVLVEAITIPGYAMNTLTQAVDLQDRFGSGLDLLFDTYHARVLGEDLGQWIAVNGWRIGHVHVADHPGRHEPGTGEIVFEPILQTLMAANYTGAVGFEYIPSRRTSDTTGFLPGWKQLVESHGERR